MDSTECPAREENQVHVDAEDLPDPSVNLEIQVEMENPVQLDNLPSSTETSSLVTVKQLKFHNVHSVLTRCGMVIPSSSCKETNFLMVKI